MKKKFFLVFASLLVLAGFALAGETDRDGRFIAYDNGTVLDTKTNLMWAAKDNGSQIDWGSARSYCENFNGGDYKDWRMPTSEELAGLYDASIDRKFHLTRLIKLSWGKQWSSETMGSSARTFHFKSGDYGTVKQSYILSVLPVRSNK